MKMTNKQLEILARSIVQKINIVVDKYLNSDRGQRDLLKYFKKRNLKEMSNLLDEYYDTSKEIDKLLKKKEESQTKLKELILQQKITSGYIYCSIPQDQKHLESKITEQFIDEVKSKYPSVHDIEADITLLTITGGANIIEELTKKYNLDE